MFVKCCACNIDLGEKKPFSNKEISHGCCRFCELKILESGKLLTPDEKRELLTIRFKAMRHGRL